MTKEINLIAEECQNLAEQTEGETKTPNKESMALVHEHALNIIEALLFASANPLTLQKIRDILHPLYPFTSKEVRDLLLELQESLHLDQRPIRLEEIGEGYILKTAEEFQPYIHQLYRDKKGERLSQAAREVLAIITFKQPITKAEIEAIRGVDSAGTLQSLVEKGLVECVGQKEVPGRPSLWSVTNIFYEYFGLKNRDELSSYRNEKNLDLEKAVPSQETIENN